MGPQRRLGIYVGYETISIIRYLEPLTGDVFTARLDDCQFDESVFPLLGGEKKIQEKDVSWHEPSLSYLVTPVSFHYSSGSFHYSLVNNFVTVKHLTARKVVKVNDTSLFI